MLSIEQNAFKDYQQERCKETKYQIPDNFWMDWYRKGYLRAQIDQTELMKEKAVMTYCKVCNWRELHCPIEDCRARREFTLALSDGENYYKQKEVHQEVEPLPFR